MQKLIEKLQNLPARTVIHCPEEQQARQLCDALHEMGKTWVTGKSYAEHTFWDYHKEAMCYEMDGTCSDKYYYGKRKYTVIPFDELVKPTLIDEAVNFLQSILANLDAGLETTIEPNSARHKHLTDILNRLKPTK